MMRASLVLAVLAAACGDNDSTNRAPTAEAFTLTTQEDLPVTRSVIAADLDDDELVAMIPLPPDHGTATANGLSITYTPEPDYHGVDNLALIVTDGTNQVSLNVDITVTPVNDPAAGGADSLATNEDTARTVPVSQLLQNDSDVDGDPFTITAVGDAMQGTVALADGNVTFTPTANFVGGASFTYTINDGTIDTVVDVDVVVGGVNDAPVANDDTVTTTEDTAVTIPEATLLANDTDVDGQALTVSAVSGAINGTVSLNGGSPIFTPNANATSGSFIYTASDGIASDTATVTVTITAVNDGPDAVDDTATTAEDTAVTIDVLANDTDPDSTPTISGVSNASGGTPVVSNGQIIFTPNANFHGAASFSYTITDGTLSDTASVAVTVTAVNDPVNAVDDSGTTDADTAITFTTLLANDTDADIATDGQTLTITSVDDAVNGTVVLNGGSPIFTPTTVAATVQTGTFTYTVSDGNGSTDTATVTIAINPVLCGNSTVDPGEDCDGGANCDNCQLIDGCGDGSLDAGEECDDDNIVDGDACSATCTILVGCGNGTLDAGEDCDDDNILDGDACPANCQLGSSCGNGVIDAGEECDTSGASATCDANCVLIDGCGDGNLDAGEECDDDNIIANDGCSATCQFELLCSFNFDGGAGSQAQHTAEVANGITAPVMSRGSGVAGSAGQNTFAATGWTQGATILATDFFTFTLTPNTGGTLSLSKLEFDERRSNTGPGFWSLRSSLDGFAADIATFTIPDNDLTRSHSITLPAAFLNVNAPIEFRFFGFDSEAEAGSWRLDNVRVFGDPN